MMWHHVGAFAGLFPAGFPVQPGQHFETPEGKRRIKNLLDAIDFTDHLIQVAARDATDDELARVHDRDYIASMVRADQEPTGSAGFDAPFTRGSVAIARRAAGGAIAAAEAVLSGTVDNAYALLRPSGHHAERAEGKGICIFNNAAVAAAHVLATSDVSRIAFVDVDVHHGNGAEEIFWRDPRVLTISLHQDRWFPPASGMVERNGEGAGEHFNINVPLPAGCGFGAYRTAFEQVVMPALGLYRPQMIFAPFGFDGGAQDPMGRMILSSNSFRYMADQLVGAADRYASGRLVLTHEGGYNESTVPFMALAVFEAISGLSSGVEDPYAVIMDNMHGHDLLPHQEAVVALSRNLLTGLKAATARLDRTAA
jgi:acetoin utilization deacetylase AcuC-like enzyme